MDISHQEARRLVQLDADNALDAGARVALSTHLRSCAGCRAYAEDIAEVENLLSPALRRHWQRQPVPLSAAALMERIPRVNAGAVLATRMALLSIFFALCILTAWQSMLPVSPASRQLPVSALPIPTPSVRSTHTKLASEGCEQMVYEVQARDTLAGIAYRFSVPQNEIMVLNNMQTDFISSGMKIIIPLCTITPTGTVNPTVRGTDFTPELNPTTSTPGVDS